MKKFICEYATISFILHNNPPKRRFCLFRESSIIFQHPNFIPLKAFIPLIVSLLTGISGFAQSSEQKQSPLPPVFLIGEYDEAFGMLSEDYSKILLTVCGDDMDFAYEKWMDMLASLEDYAERINYDINGLKMYMYVFWKEDGSIAHIAYFPKPNSKNLPIEELNALFKGFTKEYKMPIHSKSGYSHYASASFPVFFRPEYRVNRD